MTETPPEIAELHSGLLMERSGEERLKMACEMFDSARALVRASLASPAGGADDAMRDDLRAEVLRRTYARDLPGEVVACVARRLTPEGSPASGAPDRSPGSRAVVALERIAGARFWKMSGGGNDFVVFDNRDGWFPKGNPRLVAAVCARCTGIGADAVLLLEPPGGPGADFRMTYYNADGSEAPMCGNGALCIARLAGELGVAPRSTVAFETGSGLYRAEVDGADSSRVRLSMRKPAAIQPSIPVIEARGYAHAGFADTGTPHLVVLVEDLEAFPVEREGRELRHHPMFQPSGLNIDFISVLSRHELAIRTYERGVEAETLSCGTGATAAALLTHLWELTGPPVVVRPPGGFELTIGFERGPAGGFTGVTLEGDARIVFQGALGAA